MKNFTIGRLLVNLKWAKSGLWTRTGENTTVHDLFTITMLTNEGDRAFQLNVFKLSITAGWI